MTKTADIELLVNSIKLELELHFDHVLKSKLPSLGKLTDQDKSSILALIGEKWVKDIDN